MNTKLYPNNVHIIATYVRERKYFYALALFFVGADNLQCEYSCFSCKYNKECINFLYILKRCRKTSAPLALIR